MEQMLGITKALADESRLRILLAVQTPLCLGQITQILGLAASTVSKHLHILQAAGLVHSWSEGRWHYFAQVGDGAPAAVRSILGWVSQQAAASQLAQADAARREHVLQYAASKPGPSGPGRHRADAEPAVDP